MSEPNGQSQTNGTPKRTGWQSTKLVSIAMRLLRSQGKGVSRERCAEALLAIVDGPEGLAKEWMASYKRAKTAQGKQRLLELLMRFCLQESKTDQSPVADMSEEDLQEQAKRLGLPIDHDLHADTESEAIPE